MGGCMHGWMALGRLPHTRTQHHIEQAASPPVVPTAPVSAQRGGQDDGRANAFPLPAT